LASAKGKERWQPHSVGAARCKPPGDTNVEGEKRGDQTRRAVDGVTVKGNVKGKMGFSSGKNGRKEIESSQTSKEPHYSNVPERGESICSVRDARRW